MTLLFGIVVAILGALAGALATYLTTRVTMRIEFEQSYDRSLRDKRMECYQSLFRATACIPRYWLLAERPSRRDLYKFRKDFQDWYFGEEGGGMFLSPAAKDAFVRLVNALAEMMAVPGGDPSDPRQSPLSAAESRSLRDLASDLRHQLAEDVGLAHPPRLAWARLERPSPPPTRVDG